MAHLRTPSRNAAPGERPTPAAMSGPPCRISGRTHIHQWFSRCAVQKCCSHSRHREVWPCGGGTLRLRHWRQAGSGGVVSGSSRRNGPLALSGPPPARPPGPRPPGRPAARPSHISHPHSHPAGGPREAGARLVRSGPRAGGGRRATDGRAGGERRAGGGRLERGWSEAVCAEAVFAEAQFAANVSLLVYYLEKQYFLNPAYYFYGWLAVVLKPARY